MCFELDSLPPIPPIEGGAVEHRDLILESADGNRFAAFAAAPEEPSGNGVVILPDVRGLYGTPARRGRPGPTAGARETAARPRALRGGEDKTTGGEHTATSEGARTAGGAEQGGVTHRGAPHRFWARRYEEFADDSADAW